MPRQKNIARARFPWLPAVTLFVLTVLTYIPSMTNGFIWDDPQYVVENPTLKTDDGLWRIWTDPDALPQYYPMVHTTFWIESRFWGTDHAVGYHVDNALLHAFAAVLLWRALIIIGIPWAWLAAAVFAVHPVMVESVAWVTERKNVLSIVFYLLAFHAYQRSGLLHLGSVENAYKRNWYRAALVLFALALFSKTVTCSLPAAILLIIWWKRGQLTRQDIRPLIPMFLIGLVLSIFTAHIEHTHVGARGKDFQWSILDRFLIAGRAVWFYAGKMVWPRPLIFMYPRWTLNAKDPAQLAYPIAAALVVLLLWLLRRRIGRGPLVAVLFFVGTLLPALGFVNVYPMRYSFVADHFQYLASLGLIALGISIFHRLSMYAGPPRQHWLQPVIATFVLLPLAILTWKQQHIYKNAETLWRDTIAQNPGSWMAHVNLSSALRKSNRLDEAITQGNIAETYAPDEPDTHYDLGLTLGTQGKWDAAISEFRQSLADAPDRAAIWSSLGRALWEHCDTPDAQAEGMNDARRALELDDGMSDAHFVLARVAELSGNIPEAIAQYNAALVHNDTDPHAHYNLGNCLLQTGHPGEAAGEYQKVLATNNRDAPAWTNLGYANLAVGRNNDAARCFRTALQIDSNLIPAKLGLQKIPQL